MAEIDTAVPDLTPWSPEWYKEFFGVSQDADPASRGIGGDDDGVRPRLRAGVTGGGGAAADPTAEATASEPSDSLSQYVGLLGLRPDTAKSDALLQRFLDKSKVRRAGLEGAVSRQRAAADVLERESADMAARRADAMPDPLALPRGPDIQPRPFGEPRPDAPLLNQIHGVALAAGQLVQQIAGLKGPGILALSALKGAMEGWQKGDNERAQIAIDKWERETRKLLAEHKDKVERYRDLIADDQTSWAQKFSIMGVRAKVDEFADMVQASEQQDIEKMLGAAQRAEALQQRTQSDFVKAMIALQGRRDALSEKQYEFDQNQKRLIKDAEDKLEEARAKRADTAEQKEAQRELVARLAAEANALRRDALAQSGDLKRQGLDIQRAGQDLRREIEEGRRSDKQDAASAKRDEKQKGVRTMRRVLDDMEALVDPLSDAGLLPDKEGQVSNWRARFGRWTKPNQDAWRQWMALQGAMVGFERQVYDDKGARALSVFKSLLDFVDNPPTRETAKKVIQRMRGYLDAPDAPPPADPSDPLGIRR